MNNSENWRANFQSSFKKPEENHLFTALFVSFLFSLSARVAPPHCFKRNRLLVLSMDEPSGHRSFLFEEVFFRRYGGDNVSLCYFLVIYIFIRKQKIQCTRHELVHASLSFFFLHFLYNTRILKHQNKNIKILHTKDNKNVIIKETGSNKTLLS